MVPHESYVVTRFVMVNPEIDAKFLEAPAFVKSSIESKKLKFL